MFHWIGAFRSTLRRRFPSGRRLRRRASILARYGPGPQRSFLLSWHCDAAVLRYARGEPSVGRGQPFVPFRFSAVCVGAAADRGAVPRVLWHDWRYVWPVHRRGCTAARAATASHIGPQGCCPRRPWTLRYAPKHTRVSDTPISSHPPTGVPHTGRRVQTCHAAHCVRVYWWSVGTKAVPD